MAGEAAIGTLDELRRSTFERRGLAWPTLAIALLSATTFVLCLVLPILGLMPIWLAGTLNVVAMFAGYVPVHEAIHNNLHGDRRAWKPLNVVIGSALMFPLFHTFHMNAWVHRQHHAHANDPERDPDTWVKTDSLALGVARGFTLIFAYLAFSHRMRSGTKEGRQFLARCWLEQLAPIVVALGLAAFGYGEVALFAWLIPALVAVMLLGLIVAWAPHYGCAQGSEFDRTNIIGAPKGPLGWLVTAMFFNQNYHLIHHLFPCVPFFEYARVWKRGEQVIRRSGARFYQPFEREPFLIKEGAGAFRRAARDLSA